MWVRRWKDRSSMGEIASDRGIGECGSEDERKRSSKGRIALGRGI